MIEPDYRHVLFKDLYNYLRKDNYLGGFTPVEQEFIRRNIGALGEKDVHRIESSSEIITYDDLQSKISKEELVPGITYVINDFLTIYSSNIKNYKGEYISFGSRINPSEVCSIIVIAATNSKLFSTASIITSDPNSVYWVIQYDPTQEVLSDGVRTKGKITYLRDHNFNQALFDFKNILISRNGMNYYTFSTLSGKENSNNCFNNNLLFANNNIFIGKCNNNVFKGSNCFFATPVCNLVGTATGIEVSKENLNDETEKQIIKYNDKYYIDYLDMETLTHLFYELANNSGISY